MSYLEAPAKIMNDNTFSGVLVPALTPFLVDQRPNTEAFVRHCKWLVRQGVHGLAIFGTTGEANSLSVEERMALLDTLIDKDIAVEQLLPGTGACALTDSVRLTQHATNHGCGGVLMLPPFYYKGVSDEGLFASYSHVIDQVGDARLRIYLYHIPPVSQVAISLKLIERLVKNYPTIVVGIKDSGGDWQYTTEILKHFPQLSVFPGSELFLLDGLRHGAAGCITATGNVNPAGIRRVFDRWEETDADELQDQISQIRKTIQAYPMIPALKTIVADFYGESDWLRVRPPLAQLTEEQQPELMDALRELDFGMASN